MASAQASLDVDHWRWWFTASTTNEETLELYDQVAERYLFVSDLRVLREDLEPQYTRLATAIENEGDAQTAALLVRLFHYSASRPIKTAQYVNQIAVLMNEFLRSEQAHNINIEVQMDLWTACDIATGCTMPTQDYYQYVDSALYSAIISSIQARVRYGSASIQRRGRLLVQSIDAVTKFIAFNGVVDSSLCELLVDSLAPYLDTLQSAVVQDSIMVLRSDVHVLLRQYLSIMARLYSNTKETWLGWQALSWFATWTSRESPHRTSCYPESRLRANILVQYNETPQNRLTMLEIVNSGLVSLAPQLALYECIYPGYSNLVSRSNLRAMHEQAPVQLRFAADDSVLAIVNDSIVRVKNRYADCYSYGSVTNGQCSKQSYDDNVMLDGNYSLRRLMLLCATGRESEAVRVCKDAIIRLTKKPVSSLHSLMLLAWIRDEDIVDSLEEDLQVSFYSAFLYLSYQRSLSLVKNSNPLGTSLLMSELRLQIITALRSLHELPSVENKLFQAVWTAAQMHRGEATLQGRNTHTPILKGGVGEWEKLNPAAVHSANAMRSIAESSSLAPYVHGMRQLDAEIISKLELLSLSALYWYVNKPKRTVEVTDDLAHQWVPDPSKLYLMIDVYPSSRDNFKAEWIAQGNDDYVCLSLLSTDTLIQRWDIPAKTVFKSLAEKRNGLRYGLVISTYLDSCILSLVSDHERRFGRMTSEIVFFPTGVLFGYNFFLVRDGVRCIVDDYDVCIAVRPGRNDAPEKSNNTAVMMALGSGRLPGTETETQRIQDLLINQGVDVMVVQDPVDESKLAQYTWSADVFHIASHATQPDVHAIISRDPACRELLSGDDVGVLMRRIWTPLVQYKSQTRDSGELYGDGYVSPFELELYGASFKNIVFLSTCQTTTWTGDVWEPPDGIIRDLFVAGAKCVVMSPLAVPDNKAMSYSTRFYNFLCAPMTPSSAASRVVQEGLRSQRSALEYGLYYPIQFISP